MGLGKRALIGIGWISVATYTGVVISFGGNVLLARLLGPDDFGIYALASSMLMIVFMVSAFGSQEAIVQCRNEGLQNFIPTAFWMTIGLGIILAGVGTLLGLYLQSIHSRTIGLLIVSLSWVNFLNMIGNAYGAILQRELHYKPIAILGIIATFISFCIAVIAAYFKGGVWSLFLREGIQAFLMLVGFMWFTGYRLPFAFDKQASIWVWNFGWKIMGAGISESLLTSVDKLAIGTFLGTITLGYYSLAYRLTVLGHQFSQGIVSSVSYSTFAAIQKDSRRLCLVFEKLYFWLFRWTLLLGLVIWFGGNALVVLVYGPQWQIAGNLFQQMSILLILLPLTGALKIFLIASGNINTVLKIRVWQLIFFIFAIFWATYFWQSITITVWVINISMLLSWILMTFSVKKIIPVNWGYLMSKPVAIGCISFAMGNIVGRLGNITGSVQAVFTGVAFGMMLLLWEGRELKLEWAKIRAQLASSY